MNKEYSFALKIRELKQNIAHTRVFAPKFGYLEDPATGSGNSAFGYYMLKNALWDGTPATIRIIKQLWNTPQNTHLCQIGPYVSRPKFAIMNPELTMTLPDYQTACGCTDILMHTMERYFTNGGNMEITDSMAEALLRTVIENAIILRDDPQNYDARAEVMWAGSLSHNGLTGCGNDGGDFSHTFKELTDEQEQELLEWKTGHSHRLTEKNPLFS